MLCNMFKIYCVFEKYTTSKLCDLCWNIHLWLELHPRNLRLPAHWLYFWVRVRQLFFTHGTLWLLDNMTCIYYNVASRDLSAPSFFMYFGQFWCENGDHKCMGWDLCIVGMSILLMKCTASWITHSCLEFLNVVDLEKQFNDCSFKWFLMLCIAYHNICPKSRWKPDNHPICAF